MKPCATLTTSACSGGVFRKRCRGRRRPPVKWRSKDFCRCPVPARGGRNGSGSRELSFIFDIGLPFALIGDKPVAKTLGLHVGERGSGDGRLPEPGLWSAVHAVALLCRWGLDVQFVAVWRRTRELQLERRDGERRSRSPRRPALDAGSRRTLASSRSTCRTYRREFDAVAGYYADSFANGLGGAAVRAAVLDRDRTEGMGPLRVPQPDADGTGCVGTARCRRRQPLRACRMLRSFVNLTTVNRTTPTERPMKLAVDFPSIVFREGPAASRNWRRDRTHRLRRARHVRSRRDGLSDRWPHRSAVSGEDADSRGAGHARLLRGGDVEESASAPKCWCCRSANRCSSPSRSARSIRCRAVVCASASASVGRSPNTTRSVSRSATAASGWTKLCDCCARAGRTSASTSPVITTRSTAMGMEPKPPQGAALPIWVGGHSPAALRRVGQYGDGWLAALVNNKERVAKEMHDDSRARGALRTRSERDSVPDDARAAAARKRRW